MEIKVQPSSSKNVIHKPTVSRLVVFRGLKGLGLREIMDDEAPHFALDIALRMSRIASLTGLAFERPAL